MNDTTSTTETAEPTPLKVSSNEWAMTHFHERANIPQSGAPGKQDENETNLELHELLNITIPSDEKACRSLFWKLKHFPLKKRLSHNDKDLLGARLRLVQVNLNALCNGLPKVLIQANEIAHQQMAHLRRPAIRANRIEKLKSALEVQKNDPTYFSSLPLEPLGAVPPIIQWLLCQNSVWMSVANLRLELARYELAYLERFGLLSPRARIEEINGEFSQCTDSQKSKELQAELSTLILPTAESAARATRLELQAAWQSVEMFSEMLVHDALDELEASKERFDEIERSIYEIHPASLEYIPTPITTCFDPFMARFQELLSPKQRPHALPELGGAEPRSANSTPLHTVFALEILGDS